MPTDCEICPILQDRNVELAADLARVQTLLDDLRRDVELAIRIIDQQQRTPTMNRGRVIEVTRGRLATGLATVPAGRQR